MASEKKLGARLDYKVKTLIKSYTPACTYTQQHNSFYMCIVDLHAANLLVVNVPAKGIPTVVSSN